MPEIRAPKRALQQSCLTLPFFEAALFDLEDFKAIKNATDVKVNDVALVHRRRRIRRYLQHHK